MDYSKRIITPIASEAGLNEVEFMRHVDKDHSIGSTRNGKQTRIVKLTIHSFKEKGFLKHHKQTKKNENDKRK